MRRNKAMYCTVGLVPLPPRRRPRCTARMRRLLVAAVSRPLGCPRKPVFPFFTLFPLAFYPLQLYIINSFPFSLTAEVALRPEKKILMQIE